MEIEAKTAPLVAKKLLNMLRIVMIMLRKGISKSKLISEFHLFLKRGKIAATKAFTLHHHYAAAFTRRRSTFHHHNNKNLSFYPREYEFSCSSTPATINRHCHSHEEDSTLSAVHKVLHMLNNNDSEMVMEVASYYSSPLMQLPPGFEKNPNNKQLRITDSPFPLKDYDDDDGAKIDIAAEEFIKRFYKNLHSQLTNSPYSYHNYSSYR
ncbi:hypothetical protein PIB30_069552 [Stylosanthes scabra]|uniref:Avr9/Cf-9 rapidly elicited protein n=1 Tax=Stylosanthes scabra TaxID=79078 RepID=A0ABU6SP66_9FABA|nr:hypothetical protein [Stylosanthes scabra]